MMACFIYYNTYWVTYSVLDTIHVLGQLILTSL